MISDGSPSSTSCPTGPSWETRRRRPSRRLPLPAGRKRGQHPLDDVPATASGISRTAPHGPCGRCGESCPPPGPDRRRALCHAPRGARRAAPLPIPLRAHSRRSPCRTRRTPRGTAPGPGPSRRHGSSARWSCAARTACPGPPRRSSPAPYPARRRSTGRECMGAGPSRSISCTGRRPGSTSASSTSRTPPRPAG